MADRNPESASGDFAVKGFVTQMLREIADSGGFKAWWVDRSVIIRFG